MNNNCKYLKQKLNRKLECKLTKKIITFKDCKECKEKKYKNDIKISNHFPDNKKMVTKSIKLAKMERNRISILTNDMEHCYICGKAKDDLHEIYPGRNRLNSIKFGLILPLCREHHTKMHNLLNLRLIYFKLGQKKFNEVYPDLDFVEIFKRNYLD